jgi:hypothetical protein
MSLRFEYIRSADNPADEPSRGVPIEELAAESLQGDAFAHAMLTADSPVVVTDCWKGYLVIDEHGCQHECVNHTVEYKTPIRKRSTNVVDHDLLSCNGRVQTGVFFSVLEVLRKDEFVEVMQLVKHGKESRCSTQHI